LEKIKMKVAVPTMGNFVDSHFGHCEMYTVFTLDERNQITGIEAVPSPQGCGCKSNIASVLQQMGVSVMLAGNMGAGAFNVLTNHGIEVYRGCSGNIRQVVENYAVGLISDSNVSCSSHHHHEGLDHVCNH
jgi:predicted Fe-Mo cluster-binding NifX family protein